MDFKIGDTVIYRNPMTRTFDRIVATAIQGDKFNGIQVAGQIPSMLGCPTLVLGASLEHVEDVIKKY